MTIISHLHTNHTRTKSKKRNHRAADPNTPTQIVPGFNIHVRINDLDWQPDPEGCVYAEVHSHQAGEVYLEDAQLQAVTCWMHVTRYERNTASTYPKGKKKQPTTT